MKTYRFVPDRRPAHQRGAALIVGLIMLLLMTMVGVAGMRDTLLQEKMAGNMRDREMALQAAESALRAAEISLSGTTAPPISNSSGKWDLATSGGQTAMARMDSSNNRVSEPKFWSSVWSWSTNGKYVTYGTDSLSGTSRALPDVKEQPKYVIEKLDPSQTDRNQYTDTGSSSASFVTEADLGTVEDITAVVPDYRITARGVGATADAVVILQSTFRRSQP